MASFQSQDGRGGSEGSRGRESGGGRGGRSGGRPQRLPRRNVTVGEVLDLTPQLRRVTAVGDLKEWPISAPGGHFKLFIPEADGEYLMRTYTARAYDAENERLTIDFALHAEGPATAWVRNAEPGAAFQVAGSARPGYQPSDGAPWTVFIADQSALPAVAAAVELLPAGYAAHLLIEVPSESEKLEFSSDADLEVDWIIEAGKPCQQLVAAATELTLADGEGDVWVGCEADAMREIRRDLLHTRNLSPRSLHTRAYWKQAVANHSDHDTGDDVD